MDGQINDPKGNLFHPTKDQAMLHKAGWRIVERKKNGCMWIVRWYDPLGGDVWNQGTAVTIQKGRKKNVLAII